MSAVAWAALLDDVTAIPGVRAAVVVAADDGLVIHEAAMGDLDPADVAALAAALVRRGARLLATLGGGRPQVLQLGAAGGTIVAAAGPDPLWLIAVAGPEAELGRLRLLLGDRAGVMR
jgi:predicted regulator of Ras-like GTPase activity (Roadblock/LC7/MglB family)